MTEFPTKVKAGWKDYSILEWHPVRATEARRYGETRHLSHEIAVDRTYGDRQAASTLLHELLHVVYYQWSLKDTDDEERTVSQLADGLSTLWRDSPDVFAWISENLTA